MAPIRRVPTLPVSLLAFLVVAATPLAGCGGLARTPETPEAIAARRTREADETRRFHAEALAASLDRLDREEREGLPVDILVLSGGGDFGAFGAGVLEGWSEIEDPAWRLPEFDAVTGTSTGAILAPLAFVGSPRSLRLGAEMYANPPKDLVTQRGLVPFWPWNVSLADPSGLRRTLETQLDGELLAALREGARKGRLLNCAATNLDFGTFRPFDLLAGAGTLDDEAFRAAIVDRIMASSAVPGVFPPVEVDGHVYIDGGVTQNAWSLRDQTTPGSLLHEWERTHPDRPLPLLRVWYVINNQLFQPPETVDGTWLPIASKGLSSSIRSALMKDLKIAAFVATVADALIEGEIEFRFIAIPEDWRPPVEGAFKTETMRELVELGRRMGRDPSSWRSEVPEADGVEVYAPVQHHHHRSDRRDPAPTGG